MQIKTQNREKNTVIIEIEAEHAALATARDKALAEASREVKIQGFRPGKAPKEMVERAINPEFIDNQAAQNLISDLYPEVIKEASIDPVDYPKVEIVQQKKDQPFIFKLTIDVYPEIKLGNYKGLKAEKTKVEVTDEDIDKVLANLQKRMAVKKEDGSLDEPTLDDEFAKKVSRHQTLEDLKKEVNEGMLKDRQGQAEAEVKDKLVAEASSHAEVEMPKGMVDREVDIMIDELRSSISRSGLNFEDYLKAIKKEESAMRDDLRKTAEMRVKGKVVLREIAKVEKIEVKEEELEDEYKLIANSSGEKIDDLKKRLDSHALEYITDYLLRRKALDFILEKAKITEKEVA